MSKVKIQGNASGTGVLTVTAPNTSTDRTITLPDSTGTILDENSSLPAANLTGTVADARISTLTASKLTGALPAISGAALTGLASPAITKVTQGYTSETRTVYSYNRDLFANNLNFVGQKQAISFTKDSATTDLLIQWSMSLTQFRRNYVMAVYTGSSGSASNMKRFALNASVNFGEQSNTPLTFNGHAIWTGIGSGSQTWYWSIGSPNDGGNSSYTINPNTTDHADITGQTSSHITVYEGDFS